MHAPPKAENTDSGKRLNLVLPERTMERIDKIKQLTSASSYTDVIKAALLSYEALVEFAAENKKFFVKEKGDDRFHPVTFIFDIDRKKALEFQKKEERDQRQLEELFAT
jgi:hypothetical protein